MQIIKKLSEKRVNYFLVLLEKMQSPAEEGLYILRAITPCLPLDRLLINQFEALIMENVLT